MAAPNSANSARTILRLAVADIDVPANRLRTLKAPQAVAIGEAIKADRQYDPITVTKLPGQSRYRLVDGLHRLEGSRAVGLAEIDAIVGPSDLAARLRQEVLSAWARADHDAFDKGAQVAAMVALAQGDEGDPADEQGVSLTMRLTAGWDDAACEALGISRANLFRYLKLHRFYSDGQKSILRERRLADELVPLVRLAALPPEDFAVAFGAIEAGQVATISEALALLTPGLTIDPIAKKNAAFLTGFAKRTPRERADFIAQLLAAYHPDGRAKGRADAGA